ncbi:hypothetical protein RH915_10920 [Serpentinicella sp. ANB-PHB4]|uniref:hypothetical protein n=1 Tax=Serpentinicella sp. ANB-PHB4 TaxID=3074076 RepID=UPI002857D1FB|nr:hypothetical protein [Serpentinicella sp. ANB-PHB4]MDR5660001.1 hypothetical protein [Serpentinicella sp. ANB-PHB4]
MKNKLAISLALLLIILLLTIGCSNEEQEEVTESVLDEQGIELDSQNIEMEKDVEETKERDKMNIMVKTFEKDLEWLDSLFNKTYDDVINRYGDYNDEGWYGGSEYYKYDDKIVFTDPNTNRISAVGLYSGYFESLLNGTVKEVQEIMGETDINKSEHYPENIIFSYEVKGYEFSFSGRKDEPLHLIIYNRDGYNESEIKIAYRNTLNKLLSEDSYMSYADIHDFTGDGSLELLTVSGSYSIQNSMDFHINLYSFDIEKEEIFELLRLEPSMEEFDRYRGYLKDIAILQQGNDRYLLVEVRSENMHFGLYYENQYYNLGEINPFRKMNMELMLHHSHSEDTNPEVERPENKNFTAESNFFYYGKEISQSEYNQYVDLLESDYSRTSVLNEGAMQQIIDHERIQELLKMLE